MLKKGFVLSFLVINALGFGQNLKMKVESHDTIKSNTEKDEVVINVDASTSKIVPNETGYFRVLDIDNLNDFYLIFATNDSIKCTIYSKTCSTISGQKIVIDSTYYFELTCKDTLKDGTCLETIPNVIYFGKYIGADLGQLYIAKNLCGLSIVKH